MALPQLLFVAGNPLDLSEEDLKPVVDGQRGLWPAGWRRHSPAARLWRHLVGGRAVYVCMKGAHAVTAHALQRLLDGLTEKTKEWYQARRTASSNKRPLHLAVMDEDGRVQKALELRVDGTVDDVTSKEQDKRPRPRPEEADEEGWSPPA